MPRPRGRPRSAAVDEALSRAVLHLLVERGYAGLTIEEVASVAQVAKTAIYRRWATKAEMVFALVIHTDRIEAPPDQGSLAADLRALTKMVFDDLSNPVARRVAPGLLAEMYSSPGFAGRLRDVFVKAEINQVGVVLERAVRRGELAALPDVREIRAQLLGTMFAWLFLSASPPPADLVDRITAALLANLARAPHDHRKGSA